MAFDGECFQQLFFLVPTDPSVSTTTLALPPSKKRECCGEFSLKALADIASYDPFKNDFHRPYFYFDDSVSAAVLKLYKHDGNDYVYLATLTGANTYGQDYPYGYFTNSVNEKFISYRLEWKSVININGEGSYKVKCEATDYLGSLIEIFDYDYCLKQYTVERANGTVKVEFLQANTTGINKNDFKVKDLGDAGILDMLRIPAYFGYPSSTYQEERIQYNNGQRVFVEDEQEPEFTLKTKPIAGFIHEILRTEMMQADQIFITDYNNTNPLKFIRKQVYKNSDYSPAWKPMQNKLAIVEIKFKQEFNNLKKLRC